MCSVCKTSFKFFDSTIRSPNIKDAGECCGYSAQCSQPTDAEQGYNMLLPPVDEGQNNTFYLITSETIDSTPDVVQLVVNRRAVMLGPAELNNIFTCSFQPPYNNTSWMFLTLQLPNPSILMFSCNPSSNKSCSFSWKFFFVPPCNILQQIPS
jgi:hypothetical protein